MYPALPRPSLPLTIVATVALALLVLALISTEVALVPLAEQSARRFPEVAHLEVPILVLAISFLISTQACLLTVAVLIARVRSGRILTGASVRWVDILIALMAIGIALLVVIGFALGTSNAAHPGIVLGLLLGGLVLITLSGVTLVLRSLLQGSIALRAELDDVV